MCAWDASVQTPQLQAQQQPQETSPQRPGIVRLHVNACYFLTTARRVTSPTWGPPPPCRQALKFCVCTTRRAFRILIRLSLRAW